MQKVIALSLVLAMGLMIGCSAEVDPVEQDADVAGSPVVCHMGEG